MDNEKNYKSSENEKDSNRQSGDRNEKNRKRPRISRNSASSNKYSNQNNFGGNNREGSYNRSSNRNSGQDGYNRNDQNRSSDSRYSNQNRSSRYDRNDQNRSSDNRYSNQNRSSRYDRNDQNRSSDNNSNQERYDRLNRDGNNDKSSGKRYNQSRNTGYNRSENSDRSKGGYRGNNRNSDSGRTYNQSTSRNYRGSDEKSSGGRYQGQNRYGDNRNDNRSNNRSDNRTDGKFSGNNRNADRFKRDNDKPLDDHNQKEYTKFKQPDEDTIRLNKYIANSGVCSRREADQYIQAGLVKVNGEIVKELGVKVNRDDEVRFNDEIQKRERLVYILLNKPKDFVTTVKDPNAVRTVMELVDSACKERVYPVGRLDRYTTGVLLFTNDGKMTTKLTHPKFEVKKIYHVSLDKKLTQADKEQIADGIELEDGLIKVDRIEYADHNDHSQIGLEIHSGRNRIVRRIFENFGYRVMKLDRVFFAGLTKKNVRRGSWRFLDENEVNFLKMNSPK